MRPPRAPGAPAWPLALLALQTATWFAMLGPHREWLGSWRMALDHAAGTVIISGPLLAGLVASTYAGWQRTSLPVLVKSSSRPLRGWFGLAGRLWALGVLSLAIAAVAVTARSLAIGAPVAPRQLLILVPTVLVLGVHALVGMVVGLRIGQRAAPAFAAFASFGLFLLAAGHLAPPSFVTGGVTGSMLGEQYRISAVIVLSCFTGLVAIGLLAWAGPFESRSRTRSVISAGAVVALVALAHVSWPDLEARLEPARVDYRCERSAPEVCVVEDSVHALDRAARRLNELARPLKAVDAVLPDRWLQLVPIQGPAAEAGVLQLGVDTEQGGPVHDRDLITSLATPAGCPAFFAAAAPQLADEARFRLGQWIAFRNGLGSRAEASAWFSSAESADWVRTTYRQLRTCELDAIKLP